MLIRDLRLFNATRARQLNCFHFPHLTNKPNQKPFRTSQNTHIHAKKKTRYICVVLIAKTFQIFLFWFSATQKGLKSFNCFFFLFVDFDCEHTAVQHMLNEHELCRQFKLFALFFTTFYMTIWNSQLSTLNVTMRMDWIGLDWIDMYFHCELIKFF